MNARALLLCCCLAAATALSTALPAARAQSVVQVLIDLRAEIAAGRFDAARDRVGLRGAPAPLSWSHSLPAQADVERPGHFALTLRFDATPAQTLAYKFKIDKPGQPDAGWEPGRNRALRVRAGDQHLQRAFGSEPGAPPPERTGTIERIAPQPSAWVSPREVQVWLPPGYAEDAARRYPVLYLHDGQNVFDASAAGVEWQVDETAQRLVLAGEVAPLIIVAVASNADRTLDYTPVAAEVQGRRQGGGAPAYGRYLVQELKPLIDARYRTRPGRADTAVGGSSLGALVSLWLLLEHDATFGAGLLVSPSVWWAGDDILRRLDRAAGALPLPPPRLWLDIGLDEGEGAVQGVRRLRQALVARGWSPAYLEQAGAGHDEAAWAARVAPMLRHIHGRPVGRVP